MSRSISLRLPFGVFRQGETTKLLVDEVGITDPFAIDSTGIKTVDVTFDRPFEGTLYVAVANVADPTANDARFDSGPTIANRISTGMRIAIRVTTASSTGGATAKFFYRVIGLEGSP